MITKELIQQNISDLSDEQASQVVELANNTFTKELQNEVDKVRGTTFQIVDDVLKEFGYPKQTGKTSEHLKNVLITLKESQMTEDIKGKLKTYEDKVKELSDQLKTNNPDFAKKEKDYLDKITLLQGSLDEQKANLEKMQSNHKSDLVKLHLFSSMPKVKEGIGEKTKELHVNTAINNLIELADFDENGKIIFRDKEGKILYNPENKNNPFTAEEMFMKDDYFKEIAEISNNGKGLGLDKLPPQQKHFIPSITGAKTQIEADDAIEKMLLAKGIDKMHPEYSQNFDKIRTENNVNQLPMK